MRVFPPQYIMLMSSAENAYDAECNKCSNLTRVCKYIPCLCRLNSIAFRNDNAQTLRPHDHTWNQAEDRVYSAKMDMVI